ncbi:alpha/beta hydrolase [Labilibaculum euxinus]|uniref:Alpha/beta fold hydrolase n=1 Tax=Labilibaculum euxinus TaxID=2686357 RepID=A0A7M4D8L5_9BACT|nr:alpha/beta hydrolase [Labilibaculum euxinus]MUP38994.1 alpha/beta fold hydrolase [Labilibaculum euxinus]MVB08199.1 alpha/beta fold hydrolase [Labilibaculum euxinus]
MKNYSLTKVNYLSDGLKICALQYIPHKNSKCPAIVMAHGFGLPKEAYINKFAELFAENGFAVILFDYRNLGESEGTPRGEINPFMQIDDYKNSISYAASLEQVDANRIGIWGTSYSGGHVIVTAATDRRVKCVVSQVPTISGSQSNSRRMPAQKDDGYWKLVSKDRINRIKGKDPMMKKLVGEANLNPLYPMEEAREYYTKAQALSTSASNEVTFRSTEYARMYEPGVYASLVSPTPILFVVALKDIVTPTDLCLKSYQESLQPKELITLPGGHFTPYIEQFDIAAKAALNWFLNHLY